MTFKYVDSKLVEEFRERERERERERGRGGGREGKEK